MDHKELIDKARAAVLSDIPQGVTGSVEAISALDDVIAIVPPLITALEAAAQPAPDVAKRAMGLYNKFNVTRTDGKSAPGEKHHNCRYFVLDIDHDKYAPAALVAYANACAMEYPELASDLRSMFATAQPAADVLALVEEAGEVEDCHPTHAADYDLIQRLAIALLAEHAARARAEQERDFAIAHDRQPYPTAWAYDRLAKANIKHIAERDALAARLAEAERNYSNFRDECRAYRDKLGVAMNGSTGAFETIVNWAVEEINAIPKLIEQRDAAIARAKEIESKLFRVKRLLVKDAEGVVTQAPYNALVCQNERRGKDLTAMTAERDALRAELRDARAALTDCTAQNNALRAELAKLGPVEWQVNTDAIGWRQSTDVEVQHIRSFAVDRVRAIRVVNQ